MTRFYDLMATVFNTRISLWGYSFSFLQLFVCLVLVSLILSFIGGLFND